MRNVPEKDNPGQERTVPIDTVLDALAFPFYVVDASSRVVALSNAFARSAGITEGIPCFTAFHGATAPCGTEETCCPIEEIRRLGTAVAMEHAYRDATGHLRTVEIHGYPLFDTQGSLARVIMYFFDITERKKSGEMLKKYEFIANTAREFMSLVNRGSIYEAVNESYCLAHGRSRESFIGRSVADVWGEEKFSQTIEKCLDECFKGREVNYEAWFTFPSLGRGYFDVTYYPYRDTTGAVTHAVVVSHDITKRKTAEDALRLSEEKFSKAFRHSPDKIVISTLAEGRYIDVNEAFLRFTGYTRGEVIGRTSLELGIWVDPEERSVLMNALRAQGQVNNREIRFRNRDGDIRTVLWSGEVIQFRGEDCLIAMARDITERKEDEEALRTEVFSLKQHLLTDDLAHEEAFSEIISLNRKMRSLFKYVEAIAPSREPVLITGETGVGKELFARALHTLSGRSGKFVAVNVAGLDDTVFSDTLFGHKRGAYTGADLAREGLVARAAGGTLFLDEIGDLNESSQVKLLRLLQDRTYYPLGSDIPMQTDARMVVATNRDVQSLISDGKFRKDLYYRLRAHQIQIPPLRERRDDIPALLDHFLEEACRELNHKKLSLSPDLVMLLSSYGYPGNVRELRALVFDALTRHKSGTLLTECFTEAIGYESARPPEPQLVSSHKEDALTNLFGRFPTLKEMEDLLITEALRRANSHQGVAASLLGMTRQALNKRLIRTPRLKKDRS